MFRHGGDEGGADGVDPRGRPIGVFASLEELKVEWTSFASAEVDLGIRAVQSGDVLGHGAEGCRHATRLDRLFAGFAKVRAPPTVFSAAGVEFCTLKNSKVLTNPVWVTCLH